MLTAFPCSCRAALGACEAYLGRFLCPGALHSTSAFRRVCILAFRLMLETGRKKLPCLTLTPSSLSEQMKDDRVQLPLGNAFQARADPGPTPAPMTSQLLCKPGPDAFGALGSASSTGSCPQLKHLLQGTSRREGRGFWLCLVTRSVQKAEGCKPRTEDAAPCPSTSPVQQGLVLFPLSSARPSESP